MTLRSPRNRRTTRSNTRRSSARLVAALAFAAGLGAAFAQGEESSDPIGRLGQRSADERWSEARRQWLPFIGGRRARRLEKQQNAANAAPPGPVTVLEAPASELAAAEQARQNSLAPQSQFVPFAAQPNPFEPVPPTIAESASRVPSIRTRAWSASLQLPRDDAAQASPSRVVAADAAHRQEPNSPNAATTILPAPPIRTAALPFPEIAGPVAQLPPADSGDSGNPFAPPLDELPPLTPDRAPGDRPLPDEDRLLLPPEPISGSPLRMRRISEIQPNRSYSSDDGPPLICPPPEGMQDSRMASLCPPEEELPLFGSVERNFIGLQYCWAASNLYYHPLYFEDFALERYGHVAPDALQPLLSVGKFGVQLAGLPYQMVINPPLRCESPLGYYRPGECAPRKCYQIPLNVKAGAVTAGVYTGMALIIP
ncbi:MAG: hypothetical protein KF774_17625 [Planctomyces sp.]|nr:hypothetical protein [Planctomyces sp.]